LRNYIKKIEKNGIKIIISAAGFAAHLPGVIASYTYLPVIGVPLDSSSLKGLDSLLSIVQMPSGIPVLTTTIGRVGAINAALATVEILATSDKSIKTKLNKFRNEQTKKIKDKNTLLEKIGYNKYITKKNK
jgi:5-(carboxyamino)imidazole ribonucleotide mutase